jgi:hypothetical protein
MIIVDVVKLPARVVPVGNRNAVEMRMNQPGVIVIGARAVFRMNVLEGRHNESRHESQASL